MLLINFVVLDKHLCQYLDMSPLVISICFFFHIYVAGSGSGSGSGSGAGVCCPLPNPLNGQVQFPSTTVGSVATYSCFTGYTLNGTSNRTCEADGEWSGDPPTCDSKSYLCPS